MRYSLLDEKADSRLSKVGNSIVDFSKMGSGKSINKKNNLRNIKAKTQSHQCDSLSLFQSELDQIGSKQGKKFRINKYKKQIQAQTQKVGEISELKCEINAIRGYLEGTQKQKSLRLSSEQKINKLISDLEAIHKNRIGNPEIVSQTSMAHNPRSQTMPQKFKSNPYIEQQQSPLISYMLPFPYNPYPPYPQFQSKKHKRRLRQESSDSQESLQGYNFRKRKQKKLPKPSKRQGNRRQRLILKMKKVFYAVAFTKFLKSETKKLASKRKVDLKKFWDNSFKTQVNCLKDWLLQNHKLSISIILEKASLPFRLRPPSKKTLQTGNLSQRSFESTKVRRQKQNLLLKIIEIGLTKMLEESTPQKISAFVDLIVYLCRKNSFPIGRFWSAYEIQQLCISEEYGFIRMDQSLQKFLIGVLVFIKVLVFNMFLQPHKFDSNNFPKNKQPLYDNMIYLGSILYELAKEVIEKYRRKQRNQQIYKAGNWLQVSQEFMIECSEPMMYGTNSVEEGEYISGLVTPRQFECLREHSQWSDCTNKIKKIIDIIHRQMECRGRQMRKQLKNRIYN